MKTKKHYKTLKDPHRTIVFRPLTLKALGATDPMQNKMYTKADTNK